MQITVVNLRTHKKTGDPWEIDHDVPRARGGTDHEKNLRLAHRSCNRSKSAA